MLLATDIAVPRTSEAVWNKLRRFRIRRPPKANQSTNKCVRDGNLLGRWIPMLHSDYSIESTRTCTPTTSSTMPIRNERRHQLQQIDRRLETRRTNQEGPHTRYNTTKERCLQGSKPATTIRSEWTYLRLLPLKRQKSQTKRVQINQRNMQKLQQKWPHCESMQNHFTNKRKQR